MNLYFENKRITGVRSIFPQNLSTFEDEVVDPDSSRARRLKKVIGFGSRYRAKENTTVSDLVVYGTQTLISDGYLDKDQIGAIVVVTLCPDYLLPQISSIIHGELGLSKDVFCIDIPQACTGYIMGLTEAFMLLDHMKDKKVLLCTGEVLNRKTSKEPKVEHPSFGGDVATISIVENSDSSQNERILADINYDGSRREALVIRHGGFRSPMTPEIISERWSNIPCTGVDMDGSGVFNFVQKEVPPMVKELAEKYGSPLDDFDYFLFHQPNRFMLQKLATALNVPFEKMPMDITENYGNSSGSTIPVVMTERAKEDLKNKDNFCCLAGFGAGLSWGAVIMHIGNMKFCDSVISEL